MLLLLLLTLLPALPVALVFGFLGWKGVPLLGTSTADAPYIALDLLVAIFQASVRLLLRGGKSRFPQWTPALEVIQTVSKRVMHKYGANIPRQSNAKAWRDFADFAGTLEGKPACEEHGTTVSPLVIHGLEHLWLRSSENRSAKDTFVVLYYHGGGFSIFSPRLYIALCNRIRASVLKALRQQLTSDDIDVQVFMANYRKAPEHPYPAPQEDAYTMFEYLRDHEGIAPNRIILAGDSAGGALVLSTMMRIRDAKQQQPLASIASYPLTDLTDDSDPVRGENCIVGLPFVRTTHKAYMPTMEDNATWKDGSPLYCELIGLAPTLLQVGTADYLYQDSVKIFAKAQESGITNWELDAYDNLPHAFSQVPAVIVPDAARAVARMGEFVAKQAKHACDE